MAKKNKHTKSAQLKPDKSQLLDDIEKIVKKASDSKLSRKFYKKVSQNAQRVAEKLDISKSQAILFSLFVNRSDDNSIELHEIGEFLDCDNIRLIRQMDDIDELEKKMLIRSRRKNNGSRYYRVPQEVVNAVRQNQQYEPVKHTNLSLDALFDVLDDMFDERRKNELTEVALRNSLDVLFDDNKHLNFSQKAIVGKSEIAERPNYLLLLYFCHLYVNNRDDDIHLHQIEGLFDSKSDYRATFQSLKQGSNELLSKEFIENNQDNGFVNTNSFRLTDRFKKDWFEDLDINKKAAINRKGLINNESIVSKELFYRETERQQIEELTSLLQPERFGEIQTRLTDKGMRSGFACLFHGSPGTGKTETVYQIARQTGRNIMLVDIANAKSKWYGESQKIIKKIFDDYRQYTQQLDLAPILLFNEADAIFSRRNEHKDSSVDQTENAIQNIILQEMENLSGIMIATTNLAKGMDVAFERRFLYRIEFNRPSLEAKESIWQSLLPALNKDTAQELAKTYDFSGGQIENIARRHTVFTILNGHEPPVQTLHEFCRNEQTGQGTPRRIGF